MVSFRRTNVISLFSVRLEMVRGCDTPTDVLWRPIGSFARLYYRKMANPIGTASLAIQCLSNWFRVCWCLRLEQRKRRLYSNHLFAVFFLPSSFLPFAMSEDKPNVQGLKVWRILIFDNAHLMRVDLYSQTLSTLQPG